jgi:hypothetical protein
LPRIEFSFIIFAFSIPVLSMQAKMRKKSQKRLLRDSIRVINVRFKGAKKKKKRHTVFKTPDNSEI